MRRAVALASLLALTACGGSLPDRQAPLPPSGANARGNLVKGAGQQASTTNVSGATVYSFTITALRTSPTCPSDLVGRSDVQASGTFLMVDVSLQTSPTFTRYDGGDPLSPYDMTVIGADGVTHTSTGHAAECRTGRDTAPFDPAPSSRNVFTVVLDTPIPAGTLIYRPVEAVRGWEYGFPA